MPQTPASGANTTTCSNTATATPPAGQATVSGTSPAPTAPPSNPPTPPERRPCACDRHVGQPVLLRQNERGTGLVSADRSLLAGLHTGHSERMKGSSQRASLCARAAHATVNEHPA